MDYLNMSFGGEFEPSFKDLVDPTPYVLEHLNGGAYIETNYVYAGHSSFTKFTQILCHGCGAGIITGHGRPRDLVHRDDCELKKYGR